MTQYSPSYNIVCIGLLCVTITFSEKIGCRCLNYLQLDTIITSAHFSVLIWGLNLQVAAYIMSYFQYLKTLVFQGSSPWLQFFIDSLASFVDQHKIIFKWLALGKFIVCAISSINKVSKQGNKEISCICFHYSHTSHHFFSYALLHLYIRYAFLLSEATTRWLFFDALLTYFRVYDYHVNILLSVFWTAKGDKGLPCVEASGTCLFELRRQSIQKN